MSKQYVVVFGTVSVQRYIFQSNRLKEIIGASYLAKHWFEDGLIAAIAQANYSIDTDAWNAYKDKPSLTEAPEHTPADVSIIYIGGGNAALLCENKAVATKVVRAWSRELLEAAPELRVAVGYGEINDSLAKAYDAALKDLVGCEEALAFGSMLYSLPVVRSCATTGLPASVLRREANNIDEWLSRAAESKRVAVGSQKVPGDAQNVITDEFSSVLKDGQRFAIELEDLGGRQGESHIAVVHADGNEMGRMLMDVVNDHQADDDKFLHHLRAFSASVSRLSQSALEKTLLYFETLPLEGLTPPENIFPFRPIVYGGDDLTFVCDGRVGLHLTAYYLQAFAQGKIQVSGECQSIDACAGVAIVPTKFPFARAYSFADELCSLAKAHRRQENNSSGSWLDFQIIQEGVTQSIAMLRKTQYRSLEGQRLDQRPYEVPGSWDTFIAILEKFQTRRWPRSRAKGLLQALTQGPTATQRFIEGTQWRNIALPDVAGIDANAKEMGWSGGEAFAQTTPYFDPLEALDTYLQQLIGLAPESRDDEKGGKE